MQKKKQHYVPRSYLELFADTSDNKKQIWVLSAKTKKIFKTNPYNVLTENDMYTIPFPSGGRNLIIEDTLSNIEGRFVTIFREKIDKNIGLTKDERAVFAIFIASMLSRTKKSKNHLQDFLSQIREHFIQLEMVHNQGKMTDQRKELEESMDTIHQKILLSNLPEISDVIYQMKYCIVSPENPDETFLTSDNPCALFNPALYKEYGAKSMWSSPGLAQKDVELTIPLSPKKALLAGWLLEHEMYFPIPTEQVESINRRSCMYIEEYVISSNEQQLQELSKKIKPPEEVK